MTTLCSTCSTLEQLVKLIFLMAHNYSNNCDVTFTKWNTCVQDTEGALQPKYFTDTKYTVALSHLDANIPIKPPCNNAFLIYEILYFARINFKATITITD